MNEPAPPGAEHDGDQAWVHQVGRRAARRSFWLGHGERPLARNLAMIGALGWLVVLPTLAGVFVGRWLDRITRGGVFWTGALIVLGVAFGFWLAWRRISEIEREET